MSLLFLALSFGTAFTVQTDQTSTVHIYVIESQGSSPAPVGHPKQAEWDKSVKLEFLPRFSQKSRVQASGTSVTLQLAFGEYDVRISAPAFVTETRRISVERKECWFMLGIRAGVLEVPAFSTLTGHVVQQLQYEGVTWVKLVSLYSDIVVETHVEKSGFFVFRYVPHGRYLLMVLNNSRVCEKRIVSLKDDGHSLPKRLGERCLMDEDIASEVPEEVLEND